MVNKTQNVWLQGVCILLRRVSRDMHITLGCTGCYKEKHLDKESQTGEIGMEEVPILGSSGAFLKSVRCFPCKHGEPA